ncbi:helix-turn-helix domain-containing protein [Carnobacterium divergens]|uniref:Helix-turn-helix transcriptional regulator n=1 Tax=Carnobacterium divergens TaxID=2748 RepID=A0AAW8R8K0_CARDV|nr:helix-turn-helix transcriptional regulator [Carnobacterium divergens]MDT1957982.1 helix-turn-helix transcriptional regulator [Carnobacterium divergens]MDT1973985.1 helix-turn-helix transcriptional regulator [Carnobacterium divergens]MDT2011163.1 helix-turn-helix transcriptional regulator [Carnobacterium divergens]
MNLFDKVSNLSKKQGISLVDLAENLGLSRHAFYSWKTSSPKADTLQKVADYFGVSTDYLLDREAPINKNAEDDLTTFFRISTEGMSKDEIDTLKEELEDFMLIRAERLKRKKVKKDD